MTNPFFQDKVTIITGASSGIGRATALALAKQGARVGLAARRADVLRSLANDIKVQGGDALAIATDVSIKEQVDRMVRLTLDLWGQVDILVANAGEYIQAPIVDVEPEKIQRSFDVNFFGSVHFIQA